MAPWEAEVRQGAVELSGQWSGVLSQNQVDCAVAELSIHGDVSLKALRLKLQKATNLDLSCRKADIRKMAENTIELSTQGFRLTCLPVEKILALRNPYIGEWEPCLSGTVPQRMRGHFHFTELHDLDGGHRADPVSLPAAVEEAERRIQETVFMSAWGSRGYNVFGSDAAFQTMTRTRDHAATLHVVVCLRHSVPGHTKSVVARLGGELKDQQCARHVVRFCFDPGGDTPAVGRSGISFDVITRRCDVPGHRLRLWRRRTSTRRFTSSPASVSNWSRLRFTRFLLLPS